MVESYCISLGYNNFGEIRLHMWSVSIKTLWFVKEVYFNLQKKTKKKNQKKKSKKKTKKNKKNIFRSPGQVVHACQNIERLEGIPSVAWPISTSNMYEAT